MRVTKVTTRNGDKGKTKLAQGDSVYKNELIINAIGDIDKDDSLSFLDHRIKKLNESLEPLEEFILPGGDSFSSNLHLARAIARRSERSIVDLYIKDLNNNIVKYLNRLSDYLFVLSRVYNKNNHIDENMRKK